MLRAILIFVLLGSTAMAKNLERMKKLAKLSGVPLQRILKFQKRESQNGRLLAGDQGKSGGDLHLHKNTALLLTNKGGLLANKKLYDKIKSLKTTPGKNQVSEYSTWLVENEEIQDKLLVALLKDTTRMANQYVKKIFNREPADHEYYAYWNSKPETAMEGIATHFKSRDPKLKRLQKNIKGFLEQKKSYLEDDKPSRLPQDSKPFAQAFKEARAEGKREFTWRGKRYLTLEKGESMDEFEEKFKFVDDQKFDSPEEFERSKDEDMAKAQQEIIEEAKQPEQEIKTEDIQLEETIPMDQSVPFGVYAQGTDEFDMAERQEKDKMMLAAEGGEVRYRNGGEVYDVPDYLQRPKQNEPQDFMIEDITETEVDEIESRPDPFPKRERSPDFQGVREYQLSQMSVDELMSKKVPGQPQEPAVTRELARRKKEFGGMSLKRLAELDKDQEQREEAKRQKDEAERQRKKFQQLNRTKVEDKSQKELDESELRKALDDSIVQAEKAAQSVDPKRFYKNMSTFNKIVSLVGLAAGAYSSYKYGTPDTYLKLLNKQVDEDIKSQQLGLEGERRKLAAAKFKVGQIAKKLALSTKNEEQKIRLLEVFQKQRTAGIKELKKLQDEQQLTNVNRIVNTRGITDDELSKFDSKYRKLKLRDSMIKGRNGLNYYVRGGPSNINKVKAYLADAQDSIDGLTDLYSYFDKISIVDQAAPIFSIDAAAAQSLRDRLVGKLRIEFFGPGVMTDQERAQAKKILGDPNALLTTDSREKPKILKLIMKLNYGVRDKLRRDGVAIQKTPNDLRIQQILSRRRLQDNAKNRRSVIDGLIKAEIDAQKAGAKPGTIWNMNEPLPI